jgi:hypothetical protein
MITRQQCEWPPRELQRPLVHHANPPLNQRDSLVIGTMKLEGEAEAVRSKAVRTAMLACRAHPSAAQAGRWKAPNAQAYHLQIVRRNQLSKLCGAQEAAKIIC